MENDIQYAEKPNDECWINNSGKQVRISCKVEENLEDPD
jgi:hypothetical protein